MASMLSSISPLDGRYDAQLNELRPYLSEFGLIKHRITIEILWFISLSENKKIKEVPGFSKTTIKALKMVAESFSEKQAAEVKKIEQTTNHDVKAIEYWLKETFKKNKDLKPYLEFFHFACTSEDVNNLSYALMVKRSTQDVILTKLEALVENIYTQAKKYADVAMLARTHGQSASPTTMGKEFANVAARLKRQISQLKKQKFLGKMNGAVGNFNAHQVAYPEINWQQHTKDFINSIGLEYNPMTTQIEPHDFLAELFNTIARVNVILIDFNRDLWGYISMGYFKQKLKKNEVGSSTMPHKVNPIDFENSEGNLGLSNALLNHLSEKLPISRWQRDLSDSTVLRNIGSGFGYHTLAVNSCIKGLNKLEINHAVIASDLNNSWEVLAEPIQTVMRRYGIPEPYEKLKALTRGSKDISQETLKVFINELKIPAHAKKTLLQLRPETYIGLANRLAKKS
ncbi:MAG: adenylosuccinate lyase [Methylophilaceae bacterium]